MLYLRASHDRSVAPGDARATPIYHAPCQGPGVHCEAGVVVAGPVQGRERPKEFGRTALFRTKYSPQLCPKPHCISDPIRVWCEFQLCAAGREVSKFCSWVIAGAAVLATAGVAQAQDHPAVSQAQSDAAARSGTPWYQRFTTSNSLTETVSGDASGDRAIAPTWTLNQRWGITVDVREARRIERLPEGGRGDQTSVGAYYQFTPGVRVGGEVSVEAGARPGAAAIATPESEEPRADVRIESAFRF